MSSQVPEQTILRDPQLLFDSLNYNGICRLTGRQLLDPHPNLHCYGMA